MKTNSKFVERMFIALVTFGSTVLMVQPAIAQTWVTNTPMQVARWSHTATLLTNGSVLIAGGTIYNMDGNFANTNACELYNPATGTSTLSAPMQDYRDSHRATLLANGQVLITGGGGDASSETYDPTSDSWINFASMSDERIDHTATLLPNGQVLAAGGYNDDTGDELSSAELYDPTSGTWTSTAPMPYAADTLASVLLTNGLVLVCGGYNAYIDSGTSLSNAVLYNPVSQTWMNTASMNEARSGHTATLLPDGKVLVVGGNGDASAEIYDPVAGTWNMVSSMNDGRQYPQAVLLPNGQVLVLGGDPNNTDVEMYDERNDQWFYTASLPVTGNSQTVTLLPDGQVVVTGGDASDDNGPALAAVQTFTANSETGHSLIAHYPFDADDFSDPGDAQFLADTSGHGYNIAGPDSFDSTLPAATADDVAGVSAVQFSGTNFYELPKVLLTTVAGSYSLSLWLNTTQVSGDDSANGYDSPAIVWGGGVGFPYYDSEPMTLTGNKLGFFTGDDGATLHSATSINSGNFTHIVITRDQPTGVKKIYINGVLNASATGGGTNFLADSSDLVLGVSYYHYGVAGIVDDVQFYNGVLTGDEVANLHANPGSTAPNTGPGIITVTNGPPSPGMWALTGSLTNAMLNQTATLLPNGKVLLAGGKDYSGTFAAAELYDPATGTWAGVQPLNQARYSHTATLLNNGLVLVAGGATNSSDGTSATTSAELYNPTNGTWTLTGSLHTPRYTHTATLLPSGQVLVAGGQSTNTYPNIIASAELYDPATGQWTAINPMATQRYSHTATLLPNGEVLIAGGGVTNSLLVTGACELYDPTTGNWTPTGYMPWPLVNHTATLLPDGTVLVAGGDFDEGFGGGGVSLVASLFAMLYDPAAGTWSSTASMLSVRDNHTATLLNNGLVLVAGDEVYGVNPTNSAELYIPSSQTWVRAAAMNVPRQFHTATLLNNGQVLAAGGVGSGGVLASTELFNPVSTPAVILTNPQSSGANFQFQFLSESGFNHNILYRTNLVAGNWQTNSTVTGDGTVKTISIPYSLFSPSQQGFIRVTTQ